MSRDMLAPYKYIITARNAREGERTILAQEQMRTELAVNKLKEGF